MDRNVLLRSQLILRINFRSLPILEFQMFPAKRFCPFCPGHQRSLCPWPHSTVFCFSTTVLRRPCYTKLLGIQGNVVIEKYRMTSVVRWIHWQQLASVDLLDPTAREGEVNWTENLQLDAAVVKDLFNLLKLQV